MQTKTITQIFKLNITVGPQVNGGGSTLTSAQMKNLSAIAAFGLVGLTSAANPSYYLEYYKDHGCNSGTLSATKLSSPDLGCSACVNLDSAAKSFHIGAPASEKQLPANCDIIGYASKGCKGSINVQIQGPSKEAKCYITGSSQGTIASVESVRLLCS